MAITLRKHLWPESRHPMPHANHPRPLATAREHEKKIKVKRLGVVTRAAG